MFITLDRGLGSPGPFDKKKPSGLNFNISSKSVLYGNTFTNNPLLEKFSRILFLIPRSITANLTFESLLPYSYDFFVETLDASSRPSITGNLLSFFLISSILSISEVIAAFIAPLSLIYLTNALVSTSQIVTNLFDLNHSFNDLEFDLEFTELNDLQIKPLINISFD